MRWPDGTMKSSGNAFDWNDGKPSVIDVVKVSRAANNSASSTATIEKSRSAGHDPSFFLGIGKYRALPVKDQRGKHGSKKD
jgi:hypothetical protein